MDGRVGGWMDGEMNRRVESGLPRRQFYFPLESLMLGSPLTPPLRIYTPSHGLSLRGTLFPSLRSRFFNSRLCLCRRSRGFHPEGPTQNDP